MRVPSFSRKIKLLGFEEYKIGPIILVLLKSCKGAFFRCVLCHYEFGDPHFVCESDLLLILYKISKNKKISLKIFPPYLLNSTTDLQLLLVN